MAEGFPVGGEPFVYDSFTDTAGTNLQSHTGELGAAWALHPSAAVSLLISDANRLRRGGINALGLYTSSGVPRGSDYWFECDYLVKSNIAGEQANIMARLSPSAFQGVFFGYYQPSQFWFIAEALVSSFPFRAQTGTTPLTVGQTYHVQGLVAGPLARMWVDGVEILSYGQLINYADIGRLGIAMDSDTGDSDTTGIHIDNLIGYQAPRIASQRARWPLPGN
jgi:hypothetical protein